MAGDKIVRNYIEHNALLYSDPNFLRWVASIVQRAKRCAQPRPGADLPESDRRVGQRPREPVLKQISSYTNANLSLTTRDHAGEDVHNNAKRGADPSTGTPNLANHTFAWDNIGFDGPATYRDISLDVLDACMPTDLNTDADRVLPGSCSTSAGPPRQQRR